MHAPTEHPGSPAGAGGHHLFLQGNGLPGRWSGRSRCVVLQTDFGLGHDFLAFWQAWQGDPQRCERLVYVGITHQPPTREALARTQPDAGSPLHGLHQALLDAWPPLTPDLHTLDFAGGRVRLLLAVGDLAAVLPDLTLQADAFCLGNTAAASTAAPVDLRIVKALGRRAAPGATVASPQTDAALHAQLATAGFRVALAAGAGPVPTHTRAWFEPRRPVSRAPMPASPSMAKQRREAVVVGAGLAGASVARALADEGWQAQVLDRHHRPAAETSGNAGGLFHGTVHADDGPHARLLRAAALLAQRVLGPRIADGTLPGQQQGLLRLDHRPVPTLQALLQRLQLPADWVQVLNATAASALAGVPLAHAAWFFPGGGWVSPAALAAHWLQGLPFRGGCSVQSLQRAPAPADEHGDWQLLDAAGTVLATAPVVVLANGADAARLLQADWPLQRLRGQVSGWHGAPVALRRPLAGDGYALPLSDGGLLCGATQHADDATPALRDSDHALNFARLQRLTGLQPPADQRLWTGRVGWRVAADDRMPVAGAVPAPAPADSMGRDPRRDQARLWPRVQGLFVCTALGGRGITLAPLLGRLVAAQVAGSPLPLQQRLVDAVDPVRWQVRAARRGTGPG